MTQFSVTIETVNKTNEALDEAFHCIVESLNEDMALELAIQLLRKRHPSENFSSTWCWHIERLTTNQD